jgi:hypothetical protein
MKLVIEFWSEATESLRQSTLIQSGWLLISKERHFSLPLIDSDGQSC